MFGVRSVARLLAGVLARAKKRIWSSETAGGHLEARGTLAGQGSRKSANRYQPASKGAFGFTAAPFLKATAPTCNPAGPPGSLSRARP